MHIVGNILDWDLDMQSWSTINRDVRARAEQLLLRSEFQLNFDKSKDARAECFITLKRCLNQRLKAIEKIHQFKNLNIPYKPRGYLELLEIIGVLRPILLKKLLKIRNEIEHEDINPPSYNLCKEYIDVVWYFIKSTNKLVSVSTDDLLFRKLHRNVETQYWINLRLDDKHYKNIHITGWLPKNYLKVRTKNETYLPLELSEIGTKEQRWPDNKNHNDKLPTDTWINGYVFLSDTQRLKLVQQVVNISA